MKSKIFDVEIYYSSFCTYQVKAKNKDEAILKARKLPISKNEILGNLESWEESDTASELKAI